MVTPDTEHSKMSNTNEQASPNINQTSVKLPEFWTKSPAVWFACIEAQFNTKNISQDQTKYDYVVSALDSNTAEEIQHILLNTPTTGKYDQFQTKRWGCKTWMYLWNKTCSSKQHHTLYSSKFTYGRFWKTCLWSKAVWWDVYVLQCHHWAYSTRCPDW